MKFPLQFAKPKPMTNQIIEEYYMCCDGYQAAIDVYTLDKAARAADDVGDPSPDIVENEQQQQQISQHVQNGNHNIKNDQTPMVIDLENDLSSTNGMKTENNKNHKQSASLLQLNNNLNENRELQSTSGPVFSLYDDDNNVSNNFNILNNDGNNNGDAQFAKMMFGAQENDDGSDDEIGNDSSTEEEEEEKQKEKEKEKEKEKQEEERKQKENESQKKSKKKKKKKKSMDVDSGSETDETLNSSEQDEETRLELKELEEKQKMLEIAEKNNRETMDILRSFDQFEEHLTNKKLEQSTIEQLNINWKTHRRQQQQIERRKKYIKRKHKKKDKDKDKHKDKENHNDKDKDKDKNNNNGTQQNVEKDEEKKTETETTITTNTKPEIDTKLETEPKREMSTNELIKMGQSQLQSMDDKLSLKHDDNEDIDLFSYEDGNNNNNNHKNSDDWSMIMDNMDNMNNMDNKPDTTQQLLDAWDSEVRDLMNNSNPHNNDNVLNVETQQDETTIVPTTDLIDDGDGNTEMQSHMDLLAELEQFSQNL